MRRTLVNGRWPLLLPEHRAERREWPWWEATRLAAMHHVISGFDLPIVWDVGAEEGDFPALWASWGCRVLMAEPNPRVWPNIKAIWDANLLDPPLLCFPGFLADRCEGGSPESVYENAWPECANGDVIGDHGFCQLGERPEIPVATIDAFTAFGVPGPDVITMDVEGSELFVLKGAVTTLAARRPHVFVSVHPEFMAHHYGIDDGEAVVRKFMADAGYGETYLCTDHEAHWWFAPR